MSGATFRASFEDREVLRALDGFARAGRDPGMLLRPIGVALVRGTHDRFRAQVDPEGNPWEPLQPWYAAIKRNSRILKESGALEGSIAEEVSGRELAVGSARIYAGVQQFGAVIRPVHGPLLVFHDHHGNAWGAAREVFVPARPYLGISAADERAVLEVAEAVLWRVARL